MLKQRLAEVELLAGELALGRAHLNIIDVGADHDGEVGGHGPRRSGPEDGVGIFLITHLDGHGHGGVLTILVHIGIHAQLVRGKRRLILRAVRQHAVALVGQALAALVRLGIYVFAHRKSPSCTVHWSYRSIIGGD